MAMTDRNNAKFDSIIMFTLDELVPQDHLVRKLESAQKPYETMKHVEYSYDEESGEEKQDIATKIISESTTDPESGCFHKGEKERCFAYSHQTFCDRYSFVLSVVSVPGNVHDSVSFFDAYEHLMNGKYGKQIKNISLDAGYMTPAICREIIKNGQVPYMSYKRPMTKKGFFKKYEYAYDERYGCYICPNEKILSYTTTTREGYRQYKSDAKECENCLLRERCTKIKNKTKVINRHLWEAYREQVEEVRHTQEWKEIYARGRPLDFLFWEEISKKTIKKTNLEKKIPCVFKTQGILSTVCKDHILSIFK